MLHPNPDTLTELVVLELRGIALILIFTVIAGFVLRRTCRAIFGDEFIEQNPAQ
jgi:hypothetical protein